MSTHTHTYTVVDVRKVFENFHADLRMLAVNTGGMSLQSAENLAHDVLVFATENCIRAVHIQQLDAAGDVQNASKYSVRTDATGDSDRPGSNQWPRVYNARLIVLIEYTDADAAKIQQLQASGRLKDIWCAASTSTDYSHMHGREGRTYSSNGYGLKRESFSTG
ncbi:MAG: hypothetical protein MPL62_07900 [Alphaproteobacteria bacterium]|nr:hypothetical protein [Alphaproteobacteria bacterium]